MANKLLYAPDGESIKSIDLPQYPDEAWNWISGGPDVPGKDKQAKHYYSRVAAVYRVANMSAEAIASIPFVILDSSGEDWDKSDDWKNKIGFMPHPKELFRLWRLSLFMTCSAYGFMEGNRVIKDLRYIVPTTITPVISASAGLEAFKRSINNEVTEYKSVLDGGPIFYMHRMDHTTEIKPTKHTEFEALMSSAGILYNSDAHIKRFFERGGIKPTMLMLKGMTTKENAQKIEKLWDKVVRGFSNSLGKIFQGMDKDSGLEPVVIGDGIDNLKDSAIHKQAIEDIAIAAGMPMSLLLANSANYATAQVEKATWFNNSVVPWADWMAEVLNEQLFKPMDLRFQFQPEITNEGTKEEQERAGAYAALVASNIYPETAAQMLGYELPPDMEDYSELTDQYFEMLTKKAEASQPTATIETPEIPEPKPPKPKPDLDKAPQPKTLDSEPATLTIDQLGELKNWRGIAFRKLKRGDDLSFPFVAKSLDEDTAGIIRTRLPGCKTEVDIREAFDLTAQPDSKPVKSDLIAVAEALNKAVELSMISEPRKEVDGQNKEAKRNISN